MSALLNNVDYNVTGNTSSPDNVKLNATGPFGNVWLIGASNASTITSMTD